MRYLQTSAVILLLMLLTTSSAFAGPKTEAALKGEVRAAERVLAAAQARLSESRHVLSAFRTNADSYGVSTARWLWLANEVGWPRSEWGQLMYVIHRESRGIHTSTNSSSGAAGLLQFMPQWYTGQWSLKSFNPYNAEENLQAGYKLWKMQGWTPWAL